MTAISSPRRTVIAAGLVSVILGAGALLAFLPVGSGPGGAGEGRTVGQQLESGSLYGAGEAAVGERLVEVTHLHQLAEEMGVESRELAGALDAVQAGQAHYGVGHGAESLRRALAEILGMEVWEVDAAVATVMGRVADAALMERLDVAVAEGDLAEAERRSVLRALDLEMPDQRPVPQG